MCIDKNINNHPDLIPLRKILPNTKISKPIEIIRSKKIKKVIRLTTLPDGEIIIGKLSKLKSIKIEEFIYLQILSKYDFPRLQCYGSVKASLDDYCWLYISEAKGESFDTNKKWHHAACIDWFAQLHSTSLPNELISALPDKGLTFLSDYLHQAKQNILKKYGEVNLEKEYYGVLQNLLSDLCTIELHWKEIKKASEYTPPSLIHGDFHKSNFYLKKNKSGTSLITFDWENAGWGIPILDLGSPIVYNARDSQLLRYFRQLKQTSINQNIEELRYIVNVARVLKLAIYIYWDSMSLDSNYIVRLMRRMKDYHALLVNGFKKVEWNYNYG